MKTYLCFFAIVILAMGWVSAEEPIVRVDFESFPLGLIDSARLERAFGPLAWHSLEDRVAVISAGGSRGDQVLEIRYPAGAFGSKKSGASFVAELPPAEEYFLSYRFRFSEGFPFVKGGKLPGLSSGGSKYTGGRQPPKTGGWSARYMWRREGDLELYLYHPEMKAPTGDRVPLDFRCEPFIWYTLTQRIRVNHLGKANGLIQVWIDGRQSLNLTGLQLRSEDLGLIDSFLFSTFFGGGSKSWAPEAACSIQFDQFVISSSAPDDVKLGGD
ncbi:MAG: polysaccharide lyase [Verrucomicrobiota bacterium]